MLKAKRDYNAMDKKRQTRLARNLTAKFAGRYNKAATFTDRKKESKRGKTKHKGKNFESL